MIIGVVVAIIAVWYFFLRKKKKAESSYRAAALRMSGCPCKDGTYADHCCDVGVASAYDGSELYESNYKAVKPCPPGVPPPCNDFGIPIKTTGPTMPTTSGRTAGLSSVGISGTAKKSAGISGTGTVGTGTPQGYASGCEKDEHICGIGGPGNNYIKCCKTSKDGSSVFSHLGAMV